MLVRSWWTNPFSGIQWRGKKGEMRTSHRHDGRTMTLWCHLRHEETRSTREPSAAMLRSSSVAAFRPARPWARFIRPQSSGKISKCILILHASLIIVSLSALNLFHTESYNILTPGTQPAITKIVSSGLGCRILINCKVWWRQPQGIWFWRTEKCKNRMICAENLFLTGSKTAKN
jgi:hypothetical protein